MNIKRAEQLKISHTSESSFYGGDQSWFSSNTHAMGGCSSVAAANCLRALIRLDAPLRRTILKMPQMPPHIKNALCAPNPTKENFSILMNGIYKSMGAFELFPLNLIYDKKSRDNKFFQYVRPNTGQTNIGFIIGIIRFAKKFGINLCVHSLPTAFCPKEEARDFIKKGLEASGSVVFMTSYNKHNLKMFAASSDLSDKLTGGYDATMKCHFATITDMDEDRLLITTWGKPAVGDFTEISKSWQSIKAFESTLFYISNSDKRTSRKCMLFAVKPFIQGILQAILRRKLDM